MENFEKYLRENRNELDRMEEFGHDHHVAAFAVGHVVHEFAAHEDPVSPRALALLHAVHEVLDGVDARIAEGEPIEDLLAGRQGKAKTNLCFNPFFEAADNLISWFENTDGNGSFGPQQIVGNVNNPRTVYALDVDSDDDLDVVAHSDLDNELVWFENLDGLGTFGPSILIRENVFDVEELNAGDIDNDGDDDLLSNLTYYENVGGSFVLRQILNGNGVWSVRLVDFEGEKK